MNWVARQFAGAHCQPVMLGVSWIETEVKKKTMESNLVKKDFKIRNGKPSDHARIVSVMQNWWNGRDLTAMLPKLFLIHFRETTFIVERGNELIGFLVGFLSQSRRNEGYIHFVGVHPGFRNDGIGTFLYERFFELCRKQSRTIIRACTSPVNKGSIEFHIKMGFQIEPGNGEMDGFFVMLDYNRPGDPKVLFTRILS